MRRVLVLLFSSSFSLVAEPVYTIGRAPQLSAMTTSKLWTPFVEYLNAKTPHQYRLLVYQDRSEFEYDLTKAIPDFYYGNPGYSVIGKHLHDYRPILRSSDRQLKGIVVARKDSKLSKVKDLQGLEIVFPGRNAFAASLYIRSLLRSDYNLSYKTNYVKGHDNVYRAVMLGRYPAGGGVYATLDRERPVLKNKLKVIFETPPMAPHPVVAHPRVPKAVVDKFIETVLAMTSDPVGQKILKDIKLAAPTIADYQKDYAPIESLALDLYSTLVK